MDSEQQHSERSRDPAGSTPAEDDPVRGARWYARARRCSPARRNRDGASSCAPLPISAYGTLTAPEVVARLGGLSDAELALVERHERASIRRSTILARIGELRGSALRGALQQVPPLR